MFYPCIVGSTNTPMQNVLNLSLFIKVPGPRRVHLLPGLLQPPHKQLRKDNVGGGWYEMIIGTR